MAITLPSLEIPLGVGIVVFLVLYFSFKLDKEHWALKVLASFFALFILLIVPQTYVNYDYTCNAVVNQTIVNGNEMTYDYEDYCVPNDMGSATNFYTAYLWFLRIVAAYLLVYYSYITFKYFGLIDKIKGK